MCADRPHPSRVPPAAGLVRAVGRSGLCIGVAEDRDPGNVQRDLLHSSAMTVRYQHLGSTDSSGDIRTAQCGGQGADCGGCMSATHLTDIEGLGSSSGCVAADAFRPGLAWRSWSSGVWLGFDCGCFGAAAEHGGNACACCSRAATGNAQCGAGFYVSQMPSAVRVLCVSLRVPTNRDAKNPGSCRTVPIVLIVPTYPYT